MTDGGRRRTKRKEASIKAVTRPEQLIQTWKLPSRGIWNRMTTMATTIIGITSSITNRITMTLGTGAEEAEAVKSNLPRTAPQTYTPTSIPPDGGQNMGARAAKSRPALMTYDTLRFLWHILSHSVDFSLASAHL